MEKTELNNIQKGSDKNLESEKEGNNSKKRYRLVISESLHYFYWYDDYSERYYRAVFNGNGEICQAYSRRAEEDSPDTEWLCDKTYTDGVLMISRVLEEADDVDEEKLREFAKDGLPIGEELD